MTRLPTWKLLAAVVAIAATGLIMAGAALPAIRAAGRLSGPDGSELDSLRREVAYRTAALEAARHDSIVLLVDPASGMLELRHGATLLRRVGTTRIETSPGLRFAHPDSGLTVRVSRRSGLIPPEPVRHVAAPADTAEANRMPTDLPKESAPAVVTVRCGPDLVIRLSPDDRGGDGALRGVGFRTAERISDNLGGLFAGTHPEDIVVRAADADIRALYRALSEGSEVVVRTGPSSVSRR